MALAVSLIAVALAVLPVVASADLVVWKEVASWVAVVVPWDPTLVDFLVAAVLADLHGVVLAVQTEEAVVVSASEEEAECPDLLEEASGVVVPAVLGAVDPLEYLGRMMTRRVMAWDRDLWGTVAVVPWDSAALLAPV